MPHHIQECEDLPGEASLVGEDISQGNNVSNFNSLKQKHLKGNGGEGNFRKKKALLKFSGGSNTVFSQSK